LYDALDLPHFLQSLQRCRHGRVKFGVGCLLWCGGTAFKLL